MSTRPAWTTNLALLTSDSLNGVQTSERPELLSMRVPSTTELDVGFLVHLTQQPDEPDSLLLRAWDLDYKRTQVSVEGDDSLTNLAASVIAASHDPYAADKLNPDTAFPLHGMSWTSDPVFNVHVALSSYTNWLSWRHWRQDFFELNTDVTLASTSPADPLTEVNLIAHNRRIDFLYEPDHAQGCQISCWVWPRGVRVPSLRDHSRLKSLTPEWHTSTVLPFMQGSKVLRPDMLITAYEHVKQYQPKYFDA